MVLRHYTFHFMIGDDIHLWDRRRTGSVDILLGSLLKCWNCKSGKKLKMRSLNKHCHEEAPCVNINFRKRMLTMENNYQFEKKWFYQTVKRRKEKQTVASEKQIKSTLWRSLGWKRGTDNSSRKSQIGIFHWGRKCCWRVIERYAYWG
jgi:hypothetical protein